MRITISIPKPCHEDWNAMHPQGAARFCDSCQHSVADLTKATDEELVELFTGGAAPKCARFDPRQLERALDVDREHGKQKLLPIAAFSSLLAIAAGQEVLAQDIGLKGKPAVEAKTPSDIPVLGNLELSPVLQPLPIVGDTVVIDRKYEQVKMDHIEVDGLVAPEVADPGSDQEEDPRPENEIIEVTLGMVESHVAESRPRQIQGILVDHRTNERLPFATVQFPHLSEGTVTNVDGRFSLIVPEHYPDDVISLVFRYVGYDPLWLNVPMNIAMTSDKYCADTTQVDTHPLTGRIVDRSTGEILRGVKVEWIEKGISCCTDSRGMFGFHVEEKVISGSATLRIHVPGHVPVERVIPEGQLPFALGVGIERQTLTYPGKDTIELGEIRLYEGMVMGGIMLRKTSFWQRLTRVWR